MNEEKKNLTDEERKELKEGLKKKIDEMSDEELDGVAGGVMNWQQLIEGAKRAGHFAILLRDGVCPVCKNKIDLSGDEQTKNKKANEHLNSGCTMHII